MATYVTLANFTDQGIRNYTDSPKRAKAFMDLVEQMGTTVKEIVWWILSYSTGVRIPSAEWRRWRLWKISR